jgi:predicted homoserine dehydrogenase-like protein
VDDLATTLRPRGLGGVLHHRGQVEVVSSLQRDGVPVPRDLRWGVYVVFAARDAYTARCFGEYGLVTDPGGEISALYRPYHLIGLELAVSVASAALRGEPTGAANDFRADVVATAKRGLAAGEILDGEGGSTVWGKLLPAATSRARDALPIGLAQGVTLCRPVAAGAVLTRADVTLDETAEVVRVRRAMETAFPVGNRRAAE